PPPQGAGRDVRLLEREHLVDLPLRQLEDLLRVDVREHEEPDAVAIELHRDGLGPAEHAHVRVPAIVLEARRPRVRTGLIVVSREEPYRNSRVSEGLDHVPSAEFTETRDDVRAIAE